MIAISNIVLRLSIKFAARGNVIVIASKSITISHKTPSDTRIAAIWMCRHVRNSGPGDGDGDGVGVSEWGARGEPRGGRRHKTSKRFIKYHTAEHCYDTSMQILFCVHEGAINDLPPLRLPLNWSPSPPNIFLSSAVSRDGIFARLNELSDDQSKWYVSDLRIWCIFCRCKIQIIRVPSFLISSDYMTSWNEIIA